MSNNEQKKTFLNRRFGLLFSMFTAILLLTSSLASAADRYWSVLTGDWSTGTNWGDTEPTSSNNAYITNGGTATINSTGEACKHLYLGGTTSIGAVLS
jgi:hypothetical protein